MNALLGSLWRNYSRALRRFLIGLQLGFSATIALAQAPLTLDSNTTTTNGVRIAWTDRATNQVFTAQVRTSLTSGTWRNATTRYRWPWPFAHWADAPISLPAARYYRVPAQPAVTLNRSTLLTRTSRGQSGISTLNILFADSGYAGFARPKSGTAEWAFTYDTVDPGSPALLNHDDCYTPSLHEVLTSFETFRL